ncbi:ABC-2 family transporter protein [Streptococcus oralis]|uniref:ABC-2 family transporter protein n=1 Tax=Streptococcus oralis TaxID=1303 RepID=A0A428G309_STROR|nr:ABC transporter permease [Streptococcus oralis]RSJ69165.1 ABC-2 family transporter protein [Streptococcus oralis]
MIHTIQADFYRLFRSKGFWITEFILFVLLLMGATIGATGHLMSVNTTPPETPTHGWDGVQALINTSSNGSNLVFLCIVLACLVLGVDLIGKLYKNSLTVGVSRTEFFFAKSFVLASIALLQLIASLVIAFIPSTLLNGLGTMPDGFITNLLLTISLQFLCLLAWLSIVSFILYVTHSYLAAFIGYLVTSIILSTPMLVFPDIEILRYLILDFAYAMTTNSQAILYTITVCVTVILFFSFSGLIIFKKKNL